MTRLQGNSDQQQGQQDVEAGKSLPPGLMPSDMSLRVLSHSSMSTHPQVELVLLGLDLGVDKGGSSPTWAWLQGRGHSRVVDDL